MCMKIAYPNKIESFFQVLATVCFIRSVSHTQYVNLQELVIKFMRNVVLKMISRRKITKYSQQGSDENVTI